jgi:predicted nucleotidyltransferase
MDQILSNKIINEISEKLKNKYSDFKGIYFFGSREKGTYNFDSDLDLLLVFEKEIDWRFKQEIYDLIYAFDLKYDTIIDTKIYSHSDMLNPLTPFRTIVKKEGVFYGI